jgi:hypothetical protein
MVYADLRIYELITVYIIYVGACRRIYKTLYTGLHIFYRVYICMQIYMLHLSMYLYTEYSVYMYMDICGYGVLITRRNYELIFK